jgi:CDP-2,3-bis-(O-geranylgeranyl)-sn-glycerol synthase
MLQDILLAIWLLLPAAAANAIPVFAAAIPGLKQLDAPIDGGKTFRGHALLGPHKTWRGIIAGIIIATLVLWLQQILVTQFDWARFMAGGINYAALPTLILGPLFAIGALGGDAIESFFKRQQNIKSGGTWIPFDQIDYIIGSVIITLFFVILTPIQYIWIFIIWFILHVASTFIGYKLGLKKDPI